MESAAQAMIIDSDDDNDAQGGDPGNSEYKNNKETIKTEIPVIDLEARHDQKPPDPEPEKGRTPMTNKVIRGAPDNHHFSHTQNPFAGVFGDLPDLPGNKKPLPATRCKDGG